MLCRPCDLRTDGFSSDYPLGILGILSDWSSGSAPRATTLENSRPFIASFFCPYILYLQCVYTSICMAGYSSLITFILVAITNTFNSLGHKPMSPHGSGNLSLCGAFDALLGLV
jgi:hypothetical protein